MHFGYFERRDTRVQAAGLAAQERDLKAAGNSIFGDGQRVPLDPNSTARFLFLARLDPVRCGELLSRPDPTTPSPMAGSPDLP